MFSWHSRRCPVLVFWYCRKSCPVFEHPTEPRHKLMLLFFDPKPLAIPYYREIWMTLQRSYGQAYCFGFCWRPLTPAAIEGKSSKDYTIIKSMASFTANNAAPVLGKLADAITVYVRYQIDAGAQVATVRRQATQSPRFPDAKFYQQRVVNRSRQRTPDTPNPVCHPGGGIPEPMAQSASISLVWTGLLIYGRAASGSEPVLVQGNIDPCFVWWQRVYTWKMHPWHCSQSRKPGTYSRISRSWSFTEYSRRK